MACNSSVYNMTTNTPWRYDLHPFIEREQMVLSDGSVSVNILLSDFNVTYDQTHVRCGSDVDTGFQLLFERGDECRFPNPIDSVHGGTTFVVRPGQSRNITCLPGFVAVGNTTVGCTNTALPFGVPPLCIAAHCGAYPYAAAIDNGHNVSAVPRSNRSAVGTTVLYTCLPGFAFANLSSVVCEMPSRVIAADWSPLPQCTNNLIARSKAEPGNLLIVFILLGILLLLLILLLLWLCCRKHKKKTAVIAQSSVITVLTIPDDQRALPDYDSFNRPASTDRAAANLGDGQYADYKSGDSRSSISLDYETLGAGQQQRQNRGCWAVHGGDELSQTHLNPAAAGGLNVRYITSTARIASANNEEGKQKKYSIRSGADKDDEADTDLWMPEAADADMGFMRSADAAVMSLATRSKPSRDRATNTLAPNDGGSYAFSNSQRALADDNTEMDDTIAITTAEHGQLYDSSQRDGIYSRVIKSVDIDEDDEEVVYGTAKLYDAAPTPALTRLTGSFLPKLKATVRGLMRRDEDGSEQHGNLTTTTGTVATGMTPDGTAESATPTPIIYVSSANSGHGLLVDSLGDYVSPVAQGAVMPIAQFNITLKPERLHDYSMASGMDGSLGLFDASTSKLLAVMDRHAVANWCQSDMATASHSGAIYADPSLAKHGLTQPRALLSTLDGKSVFLTGQGLQVSTEDVFDVIVPPTALSSYVVAVNGDSGDFVLFNANLSEAVLRASAHSVDECVRRQAQHQHFLKGNAVTAEQQSLFKDLDGEYAFLGADDRVVPAAVFGVQIVPEMVLKYVVGPTSEDQLGLFNIDRMELVATVHQDDVHKAAATRTDRLTSTAHTVTVDSRVAIDASGQYVFRAGDSDAVIPMTMFGLDVTEAVASTATVTISPNGNVAMFSISDGDLLATAELRAVVEPRHAKASRQVLQQRRAVRGTQQQQHHQQERQQRPTVATVSKQGAPRPNGASFPQHYIESGGYANELAILESVSPAASVAILANPDEMADEQHTVPEVS
ncbi:uncharacterized protein LOC135825566 [Sycon ciliatum]|uniref:uncharacterized protein LOC135825566 n=1 Tax=Sycon ciliatum TaxID=27933 RepID=UPI0031F64690